MTVIERFQNDTTHVYSDATDLVWERTFDAPRDRVWSAFMDPTLIPRWWGPHGTTTTVVKMDVRPGGKWRYISHASDRPDVPFMGEFLEIEAPSRFRWTFIVDVDGMRDHVGTETFVLEDLGSKTRLVARSHFGSIEELEGTLATGMIKGGVESWDRFDVLLAED